MKILVSTLFYQNYNYGGILQAYALYHKLQEMGHDVTELNYDRANANKLRNWLRRFGRLIQYVIHPVGLIYEIKLIKRQLIATEKYHNCLRNDSIKIAFDSFMDAEFKSSALFHPDTINFLPLFDCYITGGDQMWNPMWLDKNYFLDFANGKKIAYSCSVGKDRLSDGEEQKLKKLISNIDCVSTREVNIYNWLNSDGIKCELIADPVFLLSKEEWDKFSESVDRKFDIDSPYLFAYLLGGDEERRKAIKEFADKNGLKIAAIPHVWRRYNEADIGFADYSFMDAGPREFVKLFLGASFIMTDSFHGTAFSIILNKPFYNFSRFTSGDKKALNSRLESVLEEYGLQDRMVQIDDIYNLEFKTIDFENINKITVARKNKGILYLNNSLNLS